MPSAVSAPRTSPHGSRRVRTASGSAANCSGRRIHSPISANARRRSSRRRASFADSKQQRRPTARREWYVNLATLDVAILAIYAVGIFVLAQWVSREKGTHQKDAQDYFLA